ncbi:MAG TPA: YbhB/YbcL family Raf kinase inhibitor-like protein [Polyangia bacterium]|nr:YbhB/YbcL family Raf kinase inhibitor-like protein [Polyangia bacterium]
MQSLSRLAGRLLRPLRAGEGKLASVKAPVEHNLQLESPAFSPGGEIPAAHAGVDGRSPPLRWAGVPAEARELVLVVEDPDAPMPRPFVHWTIYNIPPSSRWLDEGLPPSGLPLADGSIQGKTSTGREGWIGPEPPRGHGVHHYHFQLFAVDQPLDLQAPVDRDQLLEKMKGHVIGSGELVGTYEKK